MSVGEYVGTTYQQIQQAVADYYGSGSDAWARIYGGAGGYYSADAAQVIKQVPGVTVTYSNSGKVLGYSYANSFASSGSAASVIDSNVQTGSYGAGSFTSSVPSTVVDNGQGQLVAQSGSRLTSTGATVATVVDRLSLAAVGVSLGTKLGKAIDSAIYSANPQWWDEHLPTINPETWDDMATTQGGRQLIQGLFGLQGDTTTMYLDERLLAQTYMMLMQEGVYGTGSYEEGAAPTVGQQFSNSDVTIMTLEEFCGSFNIIYDPQGYYVQIRLKCKGILAQDGNAPVLICDAGSEPGGSYGPTITSSGPYIVSYISGESAVSQESFTASFPHSYRIAFQDTNGLNFSGGTILFATQTWTSAFRDTRSGLKIIINAVRTGGGVDGINDDPRAQTYIDPSLITGTTPEQVLQQLKQNYPELFDGSIYQDTPQEDGSVDRITYIPVPIPQGITSPTPTTGETSQTDPSVNPDDNTDSLIVQIIQILTHPETEPQTETQPQPDTPADTPTPPDTGDGDTPIVTPISGSASSLWKIYNPSQGEIDAFGAWLWSSDFIDQIKKLFNDPMQAIIGVHKVFCTPSVGGSATIKCGYLDSGVSSNWVSNQYTHIDCGTVNLPEYFGNVFDYDPFTRVSLFLPCVGIVPLDVAEVMRSSINVKLHCDVLTGALLAEVNVIRDQAGGILYTYSGSCIVTYPVSSGTYVGAVANVVSVAASVAAGIMGTVASGGTLAPAAVGAAGAAVSGLARTRTNVQHSGSFSGAAGVMGGKIPYLIITRPQTRMADQYSEYDGIPANFTSRLGACTGYVKVKEVHLKVPNAFESELKEIESLLYSGVLI